MHQAEELNHYKLAYHGLQSNIKLLNEELAVLKSYIDSLKVIINKSANKDDFKSEHLKEIIDTIQYERMMVNEIKPEAV